MKIQFKDLEQREKDLELNVYLKQINELKQQLHDQEQKFTNHKKCLEKEVKIKGIILNRSMNHSKVLTNELVFAK